MESATRSGPPITERERTLLERALDQLLPGGRGRERPQGVVFTTDEASLLDRADLRIGNLLDDPRLRRAMGLDESTDAAGVARPSRRFDRRRLLDDTAA